MSSSSEKDIEVQNFASYPLIPRPQIELGPQLGRGAYGSVFKGTWNNGDQSIVVALKKVFMLEKEAEILSKIRHRNIIQFFGVSENPDFFIVTEFAENGCLFEYLHERDFDLHFDQILMWAIQIANGVQYLHCEAPVTIIHRDLKSKNIVLGKKLVCKLCDFGTSKDLTHSWTNPSWAGTAAWMSPEIINQNDRITTASDVWSYAVVLWELASREIPYKGLSEFKIYTIISTLSENLVIPDCCPKQLANLLHSCWKAEPDERPTMREVVTELENMRENSELNEEVASFVNDKNQWKEDISKQLKLLDDLKLDLARKSEELDRRERALRKRENSQRNLLFSTAYNNHVAAWSVDSVCEWLKNVAVVLETPVDSEVVENISKIIRKNDICGFRLLEITPHDLDALGIENLEVRAELSKQINDLKLNGLGNLQYPSLQMVAEMDNHQATSKKKESLEPFNVPIIIHLGLYQRTVFDRPGVPSRYKVFVDSDWKQTSYMIDDLPPEITDSSTVIQHVTISIISKDKKVLLDSVRCVCPPFGYLEWVDANANEEEVTVVCVVTYTDQVVQPRNTCIRTKIRDFSRSTTIEDRVVSLRLRRSATDSTITRRNSSFLVPPATPSSPISPLSVVNGINRTSSQNLLSLAWRNRKSSRSSASPDVFNDRRTPSFKNQTPLGKSPIWAEIAATLRQSHQVKSLPASLQEASASTALPVRSISEKHKKHIKKSSLPNPQRIRKHSVSFGSTRRHSISKRKDSVTSNGDARPAFYLDNGFTEEETTTGESGESRQGTSQRNNVTPPESPENHQNRRCCEKNDCRRNLKQQKPRTPPEEEEVEKEILAADGRLLRPKKNRHRGKHSKEASPADGTEEIAKNLNKVDIANKSRNVYGGNKRFLYSSSWKPML